MAEPNEGQKLTPGEFVKKAILSLRKDPYKGIHSVYSGFNEAFRAYFNEDPVKWTNQLASEGAVEIRPACDADRIVVLQELRTGRRARLQRLELQLNLLDLGGKLGGKRRVDAL